MPNASRWGVLIAASLPVVACSSAPVETSQVPTSVLSSPVASASVASPPPPHSGFVALLDAIPADTSERGPAGESSHVRVPYGHGVLTLRTLRAHLHPSHCAIVDDGGCAVFSIKSGVTTPDRWPLPATDASHDPALTERGPFSAPHAWKAFAGGRDAVYALREDGQHIDRIDDQGKVTPFASHELLMKSWDAMMLVEHPGHRMVVGGPLRSYGGVGWQVAEVLDANDGKERSLGPSSPLAMASIVGFTAQDVRDAASSSPKAILGEPRVMALPDAGDEKNRWALAWLELLAPPLRWPQDRGQPGVPRLPLARPVKGATTRAARHGCGGRNSRSVSDVSVTKRAHVTRFVGMKRVDDQIAWTAGNMGPGAQHDLAPGIDGDEIKVALPGDEFASSELRVRSTEVRKKRFSLEHDESVLAMAFDQDAGEGLVIAQDEPTSRLFMQRFDRDGRPVGALSPVTVRPRQLALVQGKWLALERDRNEVRNLSDGTGPFALPGDVPGKLGTLVATPQGHAVAIQKGSSLLATPVGPEGFTGPAVVLDEATRDLAYRSLGMAPLGNSTLYAIVEPGETKKDTARLAWRSLSPGGEWRRVDLAQPSYGLRLVSVPDDVVAIVAQHRQQQVISLRKGTSFVVDHATDHQDRLVDTPVIEGGFWASPGGKEPVVDEALVKLLGECRHGVMTGPDTLVLGCRHPTDRTTPSLRAGLFTLRR